MAETTTGSCEVVLTTVPSGLVTVMVVQPAIRKQTRICNVAIFIVVVVVVVVVVLCKVR